MHSTKNSLAARCLGLAGAMLLALGAGCYQVPVTGRSAINTVSDAAVNRLSLEAFAQLKKTHPVSRNRALIEQVQRVGDRLAKVAFWDVPNADWEFVVFEVPNQINAFAMAGGKVGVFTGLFKIIGNDDQLASVLAHEIAHVAAKHVNERLSQDMVIQGGGLVVGGIMSTTGTGALTANAVLDAYGLSTGISSISFDRKKEKEADHIGVMYMARRLQPRGVDPRDRAPGGGHRRARRAPGLSLDPPVQSRTTPATHRPDAQGAGGLPAERSPVITRHRKVAL